MTLGALLSMGQWPAPYRAGPCFLLGDPLGVDGTPPNAARMYDYHLGGKENYAPDRELAERVLREAPIVSRLVRANRAFLGDAARLLAEQAGIRQFLDIGCGLPVPDKVHDIVRRVDPACRVAYADNDPTVVSHARALLAVDGGTGAFEADLREPGALLGHPELHQLIDFREPVGVLLAGVLHFVADAENPGGIVDDLLKGLPPGSHVVISHAERTPVLEAAAGLYREAGIPFTPRSRREVAGFAHGLVPVPPYLVDLPLPHSGSVAPEVGSGGAIHRDDGAVPLIGCVGRKPG